MLFSFKFQTCSLKVVALLFVGLLKLELWALNLVLNVFSVSPIYVSSVGLSLRVTVAL